VRLCVCCEAVHLFTVPPALCLFVVSLGLWGSHLHSYLFIAQAALTAVCYDASLVLWGCTASTADPALFHLSCDGHMAITAITALTVSCEAICVLWGCTSICSASCTVFVCCFTWIVRLTNAQLCIYGMAHAALTAVCYDASLVLWCCKATTADPALLLLVVSLGLWGSLMHGYLGPVITAMLFIWYLLLWCLLLC
jgi:hypothetical protein